MTKKFELNNNKDLIVTIDLNEAIWIPSGEEKQDIGTYTQQTIQTIRKDKIIILKDFMQIEYDKWNKQLENLEKQFEPLKDLQDIDETIIKHCKKAIDKGAKPFKVSMQPLNKRIIDLTTKANLIQQIEYIKKTLVDVKTDLESLTKAIK